MDFKKKLKVLFAISYICSDKLIALTFSAPTETQPIYIFLNYITGNDIHSLILNKRCRLLIIIHCTIYIYEKLSTK